MAVTKVYKGLNGWIVGDETVPVGKYRLNPNDDESQAEVKGMDNEYRLIKMQRISDYKKENGDPYADYLELQTALRDFIGLTASTSLTDKSGVPIESNNPLYCADIDNNNRLSRNTVFGDKVTARRVPQLAAQFQYPLAADDASADVGNGGTVIQENTLLKIKTDAQVGSFANIQSQDTVRYIPGFECYLLVTPDFNTPIEGQNQIVGLLDDQTGFGFGYKGTDFVFIHRRGGIDSDFVINLDDFATEYGYTLNPQKGNIYLLSYGFLGYAPAKLEVIPPDGGLAKLYTLRYPNAHDETHLEQTFLPLRGEMNNNAGNTAMTLSVGSVNAGIIDGSGDSTYTFARAFNWFTRVSITVSGNTEIVAFRNKTTFGGMTNYVSARLFNLNLAQELNKNSILLIFKNPTVLNTPTWNDVDTDSVLEVSLDIQIDFNSPDTYFSIPLFKSDSVDKDVEKFKYDLPPGGLACFALISDSGIGAAEFSNFWKELF